MASGSPTETIRRQARNALNRGRNGRGAAGKTYRPATAAQQRQLRNQMAYDLERNRNRF